MEEEAPPVRGPRVLVLVVPGGAEGDAAEIANGVEARAAARAIGPVERDGEVVDEVHARFEARPQLPEIRRDGSVAAMGTRSVGAVVPNDVGMAERQKGLHVRFGVAGVPAIVDEAVLRVQVADRLAVLEAAERGAEMLVGRHPTTLERRSPPRQFPRATPGPSIRAGARPVTGEVGEELRRPDV